MSKNIFYNPRHVLVAPSPKVSEATTAMNAAKNTNENTTESFDGSRFRSKSTIFGSTMKQMSSMIVQEYGKYKNQQLLSHTLVAFL